MTTTARTGRTSEPPARGLAALDEVVLSPWRAELLETAAADAGGTAVWRTRKRAEARSLLALSQIAPPGRLLVDWLDLRVELRAYVRLDVPVPTMRDGQTELQIVRGAALGIRYPEAVLTRPLPGHEFVEVVMPNGVWHPNVSRFLGQRLCLGASLPALVPVKEIVLASYGALSMSSVQVDARHPAGVMWPAAATWWSENLDRTPLTRIPFLGRNPPETAMKGE